MPRLALAAVVASLALIAHPARSPALEGAAAPAVARGVQYLRSVAAAQKVGEAALTGLALVKAEVPANDPALLATLQIVGSTFSGGTMYTPQRSGGTEIYEAACIELLLCNVDPIAYKPLIEAVASYIQSRQNPNGSWDYISRTYGDASITQYALLGLWEAENAGATVAPHVWDRAAAFYLSVQDGAGAWNYHRDESQYPNTVSMTAAGVGSLLICQRQLQRYRKATDTANPYLIPLINDAAVVKYNPSVSAKAIEQAAARGIRWISTSMRIGDNPTMGQTPYYALYGIERLGALADKESLGSINWFDGGMRFISGSQTKDGSWNSQHGQVPNTCWAILFLVKSTAKSVHRIQVKKLGAGTLVGGRGLPKDLSSMTVAGGRVLARPMNGAVEGMLAVLEDPRAQNADSALAGLVARYQDEGPGLLRPLKDRFQKLLRDQDPGVRRVAAWALARTADLDVSPLLIGALEDPDEGVVAEARTGLQLLSRKIAGFGPPDNASAEQRRAAVRAWRQWYNETRPPELADEEDLPIDAPKPPGGKSP